MRGSALLALALFLGISREEAVAREFGTKGGTFHIELSIGTASRVRVDMIVVETPQAYLYRSSFGWGGDESSPPRLIIAAINVVMNDRKIFVPLTSYVDLGDPRKIFLEPFKNDELLLRIIGGDAAGSYKALLPFNTKFMVSRKVTSGKFPASIWEEERYSFNELNN